MLIYHDPDQYKSVVTTTTCAHHQRHPEDIAYPGCTCSTSFAQVRRPAAEVTRIKAERLRKHEDAILLQAEAIKARRKGLRS